MDRGRDPACNPAPRQTQTAECQKQTDPQLGGMALAFRPIPGHQQEVAPATSPGLPGGAHADVRSQGADAPVGMDPHAPACSRPTPEPEGSWGPWTRPSPPPPASPPPPSCSPDPSITAAASRRVRPGGCGAPQSRDCSRTCGPHVGAPQHGLRPAGLVT